MTFSWQAERALAPSANPLNSMVRASTSRAARNSKPTGDTEASARLIISSAPCSAHSQAIGTSRSSLPATVTSVEGITTRAGTRSIGIVDHESLPLKGVRIVDRRPGQVRETHAVNDDLEAAAVLTGFPGIGELPRTVIHHARFHSHCRSPHPGQSPAARPPADPGRHRQTA